MPRETPRESPLSNMVMAVDPAARKTGVAIFRNKYPFETVTVTGKGNNPAVRMAEILQQIQLLVEKHRIGVLVYEAQMYYKGHRHQHGPTLAASLDAQAKNDGLQVFSYYPSQVKSLLDPGKVFDRKEYKAMNAWVVTRMFGALGLESDDQVDAVAVGVTHFLTVLKEAQGNGR